MIKKTYLILFCLGLTACAAKEEAQLPPTGPGFQTEIFKGQRAEVVFSQAEAMLKAEGYSLRDSNAELGYINAQWASDPDDFFKGRMFLLRTTKEKAARKVIVEASVQILQVKRDTKVRIGLIRKLIADSGEVIAADPIQELQPYQDLLGKLRLIVEKK